MVGRNRYLCRGDGSGRLVHRCNAVHHRSNRWAAAPPTRWYRRVPLCCCRRRFSAPAHPDQYMGASPALVALWSYYLRCPLWLASGIGPGHSAFIDWIVRSRGLWLDGASAGVGVAHISGLWLCPRDSAPCLVCPRGHAAWEDSRGTREYQQSCPSGTTCGNCAAHCRRYSLFDARTLDGQALHTSHFLPCGDRRLYNGPIQESNTTP
jgi:hypothetical protein